MAEIAKGMITLSTVNDPLSVVLSPSSCTIRSDFNGYIDLSQLALAYTTIQVLRGDKPMDFDLSLEESSDSAITYTVTNVYDSKSKVVKITSIPSGILNGELTFKVSSGIDFNTKVVFPFSVIRESSMLDWIQDWNGRRTVINGEYIITPKAFFGYKTPSDNSLNGVYVGPSLDGSNQIGLFGYKNNERIFTLNESGGEIGGWNINQNGISTKDGALNLLSEGSIISTVNNNTSWGLYKDGSATFATGNVSFNSNGDAYFKGKIEANAGKIGKWNIADSALYNSCIFLNAEDQFIGVLGNITNTGDEINRAYFQDALQLYGGIYIHHQSTNNFGIEGWANTSGTINKIFSLGSTNKIASWNFDNTSLFLGTKANTTRTTTTKTGDITIGSAGLRGFNWYIDQDGAISFVDGLLQFDSNSGKIGNWDITSTSLLTNKVALVSSDTEGGVYLCSESLKCSTSLYLSKIQQYGGVCLKTNGTSVELQGWTKKGSSVQKIFHLNTDGTSNIGAWNFTNDSLYIGNERNISGTFTPDSGDITIGSNGIRGLKWRLDADGSGSIAGGKIFWDATGNITLDSSISISWSQITNTEPLTDKLTKIDANGLYTGTINADNITTGTLSSERINADELLSNGSKWALKKDGSGYLANNNIAWDVDGNLNIKADVSLKTLRYQLTEPSDDSSSEGQLINDAFVSLSANDERTIRLPHLSKGECRIIKLFYTSRSRTTGNLTIKVDSSTDSIVIGVDTYNSTHHQIINFNAMSQLQDRRYCELVGFGDELETGRTIWHIIPLSLAYKNA